MSSSSNESRRASAWRRLACLAAAATILAALVAGCATTDEGDMPWNAPQSWEGSPGIPGLPRY